jgi:hypothetical protein
MYAPGRWDTDDGCVPVRLVWAYFAFIDAARAVDVIDTARGIGLVFGGDKNANAADKINVDAFPRE